MPIQCRGDCCKRLAPKGQDCPFSVEATIANAWRQRGRTAHTVHPCGPEKLSWQCVGLAVLLDAESWVLYSSEENFFPVEGIFPLELTWVLTQFP